MPFPLIPLLFGGASALGGLFGGKDKQQSQSTSEFNDTATQNVSDTFNNTTTQGFAPGYESLSQDLINRLFGTIGTERLDPSQLKRNEIADKFQANTLANQLFSSVRGANASRGLAYSPSGEGLARGLAEGFRGGSILDSTRNYAQQLFNLPVLQEQLDSSRRSGLLNIFNSLPRSTTETGQSSRTGTTTQTGTRSSQGTQTSRSGNPIIDAIAGGISGFGAMGGFDKLFGSSTNAFGGQLPGNAIPRTPSFNPDVSSMFPTIPTYGFGRS